MMIGLGLDFRTATDAPVHFGVIAGQAAERVEQAIGSDPAYSFEILEQQRFRFSAAVASIVKSRQFRYQRGRDERHSMRLGRVLEPLSPSHTSSTPSGVFRTIDPVK